MLKLLGVLTTVLASAAIGDATARDVEASYEELCYLRRIVFMIQSEMKYSRTFLQGIFSRISEEVREPYASLFREVSYDIGNHQMRSFELIWKDQIETHLKRTKLQKKEKDRLVEIGRYLGEADLEMQLRLIDGYLERLDLSICDLRSEMDNKKKLCRSIGLIGGVFISILLV